MMPAISQCPVVVSLPFDLQRTFSKRAGRIQSCWQPGKMPNISETQCLQVWKIDLPAFKNVTDRVGPRVAPVCRVRHLADARGVENHETDASEF
jgi:hypothetical protein